MAQRRTIRVVPRFRYHRGMMWKVIDAPAAKKTVENDFAQVTARTSSKADGARQSPGD